MTEPVCSDHAGEGDFSLGLLICCFFIPVLAVYLFLVEAEEAVVCDREDQSSLKNFPASLPDQIFEV
jgi:hypothetical protein